MRKFFVAPCVYVLALCMVAPGAHAVEPAPLPGDVPGTAVVAPAAPAASAQGGGKPAKAQPKAKSAKTSKQPGRNNAQSKKTQSIAVTKSKSSAAKTGKPSVKPRPPASKKRR